MTLVQQNTTPWLPQRLPNGIPLSPRYQRLLSHFTGDILASLSCHPSVHHDLRQGLLPATFESPQLMSACLALSAAGFLSRGVVTLDGVDIVKILGHLQSSGLSLLRGALETATSGRQEMNETLLATCLLWCLTDVFTYRRLEGNLSSSWRIHLQGIRALMDSDGANYRDRGRGSIHTAMKHLHQLYLSLQTLPYITHGSIESPPEIPKPGRLIKSPPRTSPVIDGFLGYSDELLDILHQIDQLARIQPVDDLDTFEADILLGKVNAMIIRDSRATPPVNLSSASGPALDHIHLHEYALCHQIFQQATLIQIYRQLYRLPSRSPEIQSTFSQMLLLFSQIETNFSTEPCHTWVAMAMPLFTLGCEAVSEEQRRFALDKVDRLEECIRSLHVGIIRQALRDIWALRDKLGDADGDLCAGELLEKLDYNIILF
ncbi:hypothetical protein OQA88_11823 [Cercophora sp. LCS_1]